MPWGPGDAVKHTGLANTKKRRELWARTANSAFAYLGDERKAIRFANAAVLQDVDVKTFRRAYRAEVKRQGRLI